MNNAESYEAEELWRTKAALSPVLRDRKHHKPCIFRWVSDQQGSSLLQLSTFTVCSS